MPLKISKNIDIRPQKIGRNDPCPCDSGKKYKKCCLDKEEKYLPSEHKGQVSRIVDWVMEQSFFENLLTKKIKEIFQKNNIREDEINGLIEALIFEEKINNQTIIEYFIKEAPLSDQERQMYQTWKEKSFFSFFEIIDVNIGKSLRLKNLVDGKIYLVFEKMGTYQINKGMIIPNRLIPLEEFWMMGGGLQAVMPDKEESNYILKRIFKIKPYQISELEFIEIFYGKEPEEEIESKIKNLSHNQAKEQLAELMKKKNIPYQISDFEKMILSKKGPNQDKIAREFYRHTSSGEELENWLAILYQYLKTHPKFQDKIIAPGAKEEFLVNQLLFEVQGQNLDKYPITKANKIMDEFSQKWLDTQQEELNGKTPRMVIMEERKAKGNFDKEFAYQFSFTRLEP
ncbi:MAG: SEC-C metal-binding domain-containing protein [Candidatus Kuenenbacteria bacterium]